MPSQAEQIRICTRTLSKYNYTQSNGAEHAEFVISVSPRFWLCPDAERQTAPASEAWLLLRSPAAARSPDTDSTFHSPLT